MHYEENYDCYDGKGKFSPYLIKHHVMKKYGGVEVQLKTLFNFGTR
jgi:hypothetical protein